MNAVAQEWNRRIVAAHPDGPFDYTVIGKFSSTALGFLTVIDQDGFTFLREDIEPALEIAVMTGLPFGLISHTLIHTWRPPYSEGQSVPHLDLTTDGRHVLLLEKNFKRLLTI